MIGYLHGNIKYLTIDSCILDVNGVGYRVFITANTRSKLKLNSNLELFTYLSVREDALILYGFETIEEYDVFCRLISVSKIGPKLALTMLSSANASTIVSIIKNKQISKLTSIPGIGKKTAERIIIELQDKFDDLDMSIENIIQIEETITTQEIFTDNTKELLAALQSLGYSNSEINPIIKKIPNKLSVEDKIREALKLLMNKS